MGTVPLPLTELYKCREFCPVLIGANEDWYQTERCPSWQTLQHWESSRCDNCYPGSCCHQTDATDTQRNSFSFLHTVSSHTMKQWLKQKLLLFFFFWSQMLEQTCKLMDSHLRSKEANMRLSQLSWAWFRKNCKQLHNSNIIMSPSIYKGGSRRTDSVHIENSESGNIKYTNEKLWKPIPYWLCCPGLLLVQRVRTNLVSGWHIQEAPKAAAMSWHDEWSRESSWPRTTDKSSFNQILTEHQLTGEKCVVFFFWIETY